VTSLRAILWMAVMLPALGCGSRATTTYMVVSGPRDWTAHPAVLEIDPAPAELFAVSDIHGGYDRLAALLARHGLAAATPATPDAGHWTGGTAVLVVVGDLIDKGPSSLGVVDYLRALEVDAAAAGGRVIVLLGNHEAEFLDNPSSGNTTATDGFATDLQSAGIDPISVASGADPHGLWLRQLPFAARVGVWFFSHAGDTGGRTVAELGSALRAAVEASDYHHPEIIGSHSLLESRAWYQGSETIAATYARAVGAQHIVFGHEPNALGPPGAIQVGAKRTLFRVDCGMSPGVNYSSGALLRVHQELGLDIMESLDADGTVRRI
jgi:Calcineurin-like phosphoesterase